MPLITQLYRFCIKAVNLSGIDIVGGEGSGPESTALFTPAFLCI